jgi:mRNA interferase MazF
LTLHRGDVVLVAFPNSDLETFKKRPALVVQNDQAQTGLPQIVLALITSNLGRTGATRVIVRRSSKAGARMRLFVDSVVVCDVLQTTGTDAIADVIGECPLMDDIDEALRFALGL